MKLSNAALQVLKSFSSINPSIHHPGGAVISTISPTKTIMARATIDQSIEEEFAVYDLSKFLSTFSLITDPEVEINDRYIVLSGGRNERISYTRADPANFLTPPKNGIKLPSEDLTFELPGDYLGRLLKSLSVLALPEIAITVEEGVIYLDAIDSKNPTGDKYRVEVGPTESSDMKMIIKKDNLNIITGTYAVTVSKQGLIVFDSGEGFKALNGFEVTYWIAADAASKA
jgi:hypothetical protein